MSVLCGHSSANQKYLVIRFFKYLECHENLVYWQNLQANEIRINLIETSNIGSDQSSLDNMVMFKDIIELVLEARFVATFDILLDDRNWIE